MGDEGGGDIDPCQEIATRCLLNIVSSQLSNYQLSRFVGVTLLLVILFAYEVGMLLSIYTFSLNISIIRNIGGTYFIIINVLI